ncbi:hypothetical protein [Xylanibacillus composti]|uniref:hypothetical protein n=1 Tax=Xylanibacillus composti TaxID=1572762 RepID=UPI001BD18346|nr:hypothetical protein [Xylanibacillus composti]
MQNENRRPGSFHTIFELRAILKLNVVNRFLGHRISPLPNCLVPAAALCIRPISARAGFHYVCYYLNSLYQTAIALATADGAAQIRPEAGGIRPKANRSLV